MKKTRIKISCFSGNPLTLHEKSLNQPNTQEDDLSLLPSRDTAKEATAAPIVAGPSSKSPSRRKPRLSRGMKVFIAVGGALLAAFTIYNAVSHFGDPEYTRTPLLPGPDSTLIEKLAEPTDLVSVDTAAADSIEQLEKEEAKKVYNSIRRPQRNEEDEESEASSETSSEGARPAAATTLPPPRLPPPRRRPSPPPRWKPSATSSFPIPTIIHMEIHPIAVFRSPFKSKFGVPRQSGLVEDLQGRIVLLDAYADSESLRGLDDFDYLWLLWGFSANRHQSATFQPTVRPPRLGGNERMGVFATRSPYRPNGWASPRCASGRGGHGDRRRGSRPDGRHAHLRHQALPALCRRPSPGARGLHGPKPMASTAGRPPRPCRQSAL